MNNVHVKRMPLLFRNYHRFCLCPMRHAISPLTLTEIVHVVVVVVVVVGVAQLYIVRLFCLPQSLHRDKFWILRANR